MTIFINFIISTSFLVSMDTQDCQQAGLFKESKHRNWYAKNFMQEIFNFRPEMSVYNCT